MPTKEILTLQFGHYANFVGTHLWNIQETGFEYQAEEASGIDHGVLYREGFTPRGQTTFTPRLLLCDLKNSLKTLPQDGDLYDPPFDPSQLTSPWQKLEIEKQPPTAKNTFQQDLDNPETAISSKRYNFEEEVEVWSDFLYGRFHPRTVNVVKEYEHCNLETPFDSFTLGRELWKTGFGEEFEDRIRSYVEECDYFQGFQILTDCTNGFSGLSSSCLEHIRDDYNTKSLLIIPCIPAHFPDNDFQTPQEQVYSIMNDSTRVINCLLSYNKFREWGNMFVPLCAGTDGWRQPGKGREFYHCQYNPKLPYHSSAVLAAAIDTFTLKYRLKSSFSLMDLSADLTLHGRKAVAASLCLPFSLNANVDLIDCLDKWEGMLYQSITPRVKIGTDRQMQHIFLRGIPETRLKTTPESKAKLQREMPAYKCKTVQEMLSYYLSCTTHATASNVTTLPKAMPTKNPFPQFFDGILQSNGNVGFSPRTNDTRVDSIPVLAGLHNGMETGEMLQSLYDEAKKLKIRRFKQFSLDCDEYEENLEEMLTFRENYEDSYLV